MPEFTLHFPPDFRWGTATSAHQVEGNNTNNDWWRWEQEEGHILRGHRSGRACDWWERAEEDFDRAAAMHQNAHRLSVEWSRIEPQDGVWDEAALERYRTMVQGLRQRGIEPMVTLHHFTNPLWLADMGGWERGEVVIPRFRRFVRRVVEALGDLVDLWCTLNEMNVYAVQGYLMGVWPPGKQDFGLTMRVLRTMLRAHAAAYEAIHQVQPEARVGIAHAMIIFDPANPGSPLDRWAARQQDKLFNQAILDALLRGRLPLLGGGPFLRGVRGTLDWIGLNYYTRRMVAFDRREAKALFGRNFIKEGAEQSDGGYGEVYPKGLFRLLRRLSRYGLPLYVTENGLPDADDDQRPRFLITHLRQLWKALQGNIPVYGYYHWSLVDNFEWAEGWTLRFGLIEVDPETQERRMRPSGELYGEICRANAITHEMVARYAPEVMERLFPG